MADTNTTFLKQDPSFDVPLRPQKLEEFIGQKPIIEKLNVFMGAAKKRRDVLGHCLFCGPPGLGKTTLSYILSKTLNVNLIATSAPSIEKAKDLAGLLTSLEENDILFIDETHRLPKNIEEYLYSAMEDFHLDLVIDSGTNARSVRLKLKPFTLIGATTRAGMISSPLRSRFQIQLRLDFYGISELSLILQRSAALLNVKIESEASVAIAYRSRGTPRVANNLLKWVRDFAQIKGHSKITYDLSIEALKMLSIDDKGLDEMDKKILSVIMDHHDGGPVGLQTIAVAIGEEPSTITEVYEPYLITQGFLKRTPRGREVTQLAYEHLSSKKNGERT